MQSKHVADSASLYSKKNKEISVGHLLELEDYKGNILMDAAKETLRAKRIIETIPYITLATSNADGIPWNTPLYFAHDQHYNFYWISSQISVHSVNIGENENVAIVIYDSKLPEGKGVGVYIKAKAMALEDAAKIRFALKLIYKRKGKAAPELEEFIGGAPKRVYMAVPSAVWVNDIKTKKGENKEARIEIELV